MPSVARGQFKFCLKPLDKPLNPVYSTYMTNQPNSVMTHDEACADFYARTMDKQVYATEVKSPRKRLSNVTWCLGDVPPAGLAHDLLWCDKRKGR